MPAPRKLTPKPDLDRYLQLRGGRDGGYRYRRRVPKQFASVDTQKEIKLSLKTKDLAEARLRRDAQEEADNKRWAALMAGENRDRVAALYDAAVARARALGFQYKSGADLADSSSLAQLVNRIEMMQDLGGAGADPGDLAALIGAAEKPQTTVSDAFRVYVDEIEAAQKRVKSPAQYKGWLQSKQRPVNNFIAVVGDRPILQISREDAKLFWRHLNDRIDDGQIVVNTATRYLGTMRRLYSAYAEWLDDGAVVNPFRKLNFGKDVTRSRAPFETSWIVKQILKPGALASLNDQARAIVLTVLETGARPSEIANLLEAEIRLTDNVPHISIAPREGDDAREIKTDTSVRIIPLVGVALEAMRKHPKGFPRYRDKGNSLSAAVSKHFSAHGLFPSERHTFYSLRHSLEKRMVEADVDYGFRCLIMGHKTDRPKYGDGGKLEWQAEQLQKIALPFDAGIV